jgi:hypothetical protein
VQLLDSNSNAEHTYTHVLMIAETHVQSYPARSQSERMQIREHTRRVHIHTGRTCILIILLIAIRPRCKLTLGIAIALFINSVHFASERGFCVEE